MRQYDGSSRNTRERTGERNDIWPTSRDLSRTPATGQYAGYYADRQRRMYFRSLRRDGLYIVDFPPVLLWIEDVWCI